MNRLIAEYTKKIPLSSKIYKREFIIKVTHGDNHYGLDRDDNDIESLLLNGATQHEDAVWVYDKYRNVSGIGKHAGLKQIIMNFGKIEYKKKDMSKTTFKATSLGNRFTTREFIFMRL